MKIRKITEPMRNHLKNTFKIQLVNEKLVKKRKNGSPKKYINI